MSTSESTPKKKRNLLAVRESTRQSLRWRFKEWAVEPPVSCPGYLYCKKCRLCVQANRDTMRKHEKSKGHKNSMRRNTLEESLIREGHSKNPLHQGGVPRSGAMFSFFSSFDDSICIR